MLSLVDLPLYLVYAIAGTASAAFGKAAMGRAHGRDWAGAAWRAAGAIGATAISFGLLIHLLSHTDLSAMAPLAVGCNMFVAAMLSMIVFGERVRWSKVAGMVLIVIGVVLLSGWA